MRPPVLHVIPYLWSGAGGVLTRLCEAQREHGPVAIVTGGAGGPHGDWSSYRRRLRRAGVTHHTIDFFDRSPERFWASAAALASLIERIRPGVIHAHAGVPCCGAVVARGISAHRARLIGQMYSWGPNRPEWMNRQDAWGLAQTDRIICSARAYWDLLIDYGVPSRKMRYLPWGLALEELPWRGEIAAGKSRRATAPASPPAPDRSGPRLGFVGRIEPRKGQLDLVQALVKLRRTHPSASLELIGPVADEAYAARAREVVARHGLEHAVTFAGSVKDVTTYVRRWDLFVSLSSDEGQGLAVLEAMAIGVPVMARAVAGLSDFVVDGRTGVTIGRSSPSHLSQAIVDAWNAPARLCAIARRARRLVERRYDWSSTVNAFERLYWR